MTMTRPPKAMATTPKSPVLSFGVRGQTGSDMIFRWKSKRVLPPPGQARSSGTLDHRHRECLGRGVLLPYQALRHAILRPLPAHMLNIASTRYFTVLLAFLVAAAPAQQQGQPSITAAANSFVQDVLTRARSPSTVTVTFRNVSSLPAEAQEVAQTAIFTSFRNAGVRLVKAELALAEVKITFSEDWQDYIWIAVVQQGPGSQMVMKRLPRPERAAAPRVPTLTVRKNPVWQPEGPVLEFVQANHTLVVLEPEQISLYTYDSDQWRPRNTFSFAPSPPWPPHRP